VVGPVLGIAAGFWAQAVTSNSAPESAKNDSNRSMLA
jgi:hypothetical protein